VLSDVPFSGLRSGDIELIFVSLSESEPDTEILDVFLRLEKLWLGEMEISMSLRELLEFEISISLSVEPLVDGVVRRDLFVDSTD